MRDAESLIDDTLSAGRIESATGLFINAQNEQVQAENEVQEVPIIPA
jgi:hypothetical protein